jgi:hypothetical protein
VRHPRSIVKLAVCILLGFAFDASAALDVTTTPGWPGWWQNAIDPLVRNQGSQYLGNPETLAAGHLMLAKHYESVGQLSKALFHARQVAISPDATTATKSLASYIIAFNLGNMGRRKEQEIAIEEYAKVADPKLVSELFLMTPEMMEFYRLSASGEITEAKAKLASFGEPKDTETFINFGLAKANLASLESRDASLSNAELDKILPGIRKPGQSIHAAKFFYANRLFNVGEAESSLKKCFAARSQTDYNLPETDLARLSIAACEWSKAVEWLEKAHNAKMTLRPNYRQEAIKDLALAVADFYLATGHPDRALASLEKIEDDFFRPGYTTQPIEYFLAGLHLRKFLACDLQLRLLSAVWLGTGFADKCKFYPSLASLAFKRTTALMRFRQVFSERFRMAPPGADIAELCYAPPWLLPAMRHALGEAVFKKVCAERIPEGRRLEILGPLLGGEPSPPIHQDTPLLLKAAILAQSSRQLTDLVSAYQISPSSLLLNAHPLPVSRTNLGIGLHGWIASNPEGFELNNIDGQVTLSASGTNLKTIPLPEAPNPGALLEKLSKALLAADFPVTDQIAKKIEGGAVAFDAANLKK